MIQNLENVGAVNYYAKPSKFAARILFVKYSLIFIKNLIYIDYLTIVVVTVWNFVVGSFMFIAVVVMMMNRT